MCVFKEFVLKVTLNLKLSVQNVFVDFRTNLHHLWCIRMWVELGGHLMIIVIDSINYISYKKNKMANTDF